MCKMIEKSELEIMKDWKSEKIVVSVVCTTYNHEKYIVQALDSFLMQKTSFPFEIIVHDDCSTDSTIDILGEYERFFPHIVKIIREQENQYSKPNGSNIIKKIILENCTGEYRAICEGDDYWTDPLKLQKQYDALKNNPEISVCVCKTKILENRPNNGNDNSIPSMNFCVKKNQVITGDELAGIVFGDERYPFHTSGYFYTKEFHEFSGLDDLKKFTEGDEILLKAAICFNGVYYCNEIMSCYRWLSSGGWTERFFRMTEEEKYNHAKRQVISNIKFNKITEKKYSELIHKLNRRILFRWLIKIDPVRVSNGMVSLIDKKTL